MTKENDQLMMLGKKMEDIGSREIPSIVWKPVALLGLSATLGIWGTEFWTAASILIHPVNAATTTLALQEAKQSMEIATKTFEVLMGEVGAISVGVWRHANIFTLEKSPLQFSSTLVSMGKLLQKRSDTLHNSPKA